MGKVSESVVKNYTPVEDFNLFYSSETLKTADPLTAIGNGASHSTAFLEKAGFDAGKYRQLSLNYKLADASSAQAAAAKVSAASSPAELLKNPRVRALLDTIAFAEGTRGNGDYKRVVYGTVVGPANPNLPYDRSLVGKRNVLVSDLRRHPNLLVQVNSKIRSSAAGRYQFLNTTWRALGMKDFSPRSQDLAAIKLMQQRGMIAPLLRGDFNRAIHKGAPEWASLPTASGGSYYGQGAKSLSALRSVYAKALRKYQQNPSAPNNPNVPSAPKILKRGNRGHAVEVLQDRLIKLGTMTKAQQNTGPGIFGPRTERALKTFQRQVGIAPNGQYGTATRQAMDKIFNGKIERGAENRIVRRLQSKLIQLNLMTRAGVNTGPGVFGPRTERAVRRFQAKHDLPVTGEVDAKTFRAIWDAKPPRANPSPNGGNAPNYKRWNVISTGDGANRQADGWEDLQPHHGPKGQWTNYVMRGLTLNRNLLKRDIVLTRPGQSNFGQAVPSPIQGKVLYAGNEGDGYGNKVVVKNYQTGQVTLIGHLDSISVRRGQNVAYGQKLGGQGSTGNSTGAHVHINADPSVIKRWVADLADGKFDGVRRRFDVGRRA